MYLDYILLWKIKGFDKVSPHYRECVFRDLKEYEDIISTTKVTNVNYDRYVTRSLKEI